MKILLSLLLIVGLVGCRSTSGLKVVSDFEVNRYLGVWYEAARYPHGFEDGLSAVSATYSLNADGTIKVLNRGYQDEDRKWDTIEGVAKLKGNPTKGWLKVSFFKPFYASYKIIHLDKDYTQAIVTGPTYGYLWILVRDPALPKTELNKLVAKVGEFGFETNKLIFVDHSLKQP